jgi:outer membrane protein assembly factor BamE (lipoprotein component of BamABCDE complex)
MIAASGFLRDIGVCVAVMMTTIILAGCGKSDTGIVTPPWNQLEVGLSPKQVTVILGSPTRTEATEKDGATFTSWYYTYARHAYVEKVDGSARTVTSFNPTGVVKFKHKWFLDELVSWTPPSWPKGVADLTIKEQMSNL